MNLRIKRIRYRNIREFKELELDFTTSSNEPHHVSLVQMPNGVGKTTTMELIRTLLLEKQLEDHEIASFAPNDFDADEGLFEADFEFSDNLFTLKLQLDYDLNDFEYRHVKSQRVRGGDSMGHYLPRELETVITESFVNLFVFNGELTEEFLQTGKEEAENALKIVNFLNRMEEQKLLIEQKVEERQEANDLTTVKDEGGYKNIRGRLRSREDKLVKLEERKDELENEIAAHAGNITRLEAKREEILSQDQELLERDQELENEINELESSLKNDTADILDRMRKPTKLSEEVHDDLSHLLKHMNVLKLPRTTSVEFFRELSEEENCICGTPIGSEEKKTILANADDYLSEDDISVLNILKDNLRSMPEPEEFKPLFDRLEHNRNELREKRQERNQLEIGGPEQSEFEEVVRDIQEQERMKKRKEQEIEKLTTIDKNKQEEWSLDWKSNIPVCKRETNEYRDRLREASDTVNFGKKADILEEIFDNFIDRSLESLKEKQIEETNEKLEQILGLSQVQIDSINQSIKIEGRESASEGQQLSIAYAYLASLFEEATLSVPFIIDSPAVSIDYAKREEVARIIPELFDQLIIFVISPERERFVDELNSDDIQYHTVHKTAPGEVEKNRDKDFFMEFQSEEELQEAT